MESVTLLGTELSSPTSGQARFLYNIARGLQSMGIPVSVVLYGAGGERAQQLEKAGVRVTALGHDPSSPTGRFRRMTRLNRAGEVVAAEVARQPPTSWYVVLSDNLVSAVRFRSGGRWAYLSNGDMALLLLNRSFVGADRLARSAVALGAADLLRRHARDAEGYNLLLGNSEFTRELMAFLYALPFQGVVYPPVDTATFPAPGIGPGRRLRARGRSKRGRAGPTPDRSARARAPSAGRRWGARRGRDVPWHRDRRGIGAALRPSGLPRLPRSLRTVRICGRGGALLRHPGARVQRRGPQRAGPSPRRRVDRHDARRIH